MLAGGGEMSSGVFKCPHCAVEFGARVPEMASLLRRLLDEAECDSQCCVLVHYCFPLLVRRVLHYREEDGPSPESMVEIPDRDVYADIEAVFEMLLRVFREQHAYWRGRGPSLTDYDEEAERARLREV